MEEIKENKLNKWLFISSVIVFSITTIIMTILLIRCWIVDSEYSGIFRFANFVYVGVTALIGYIIVFILEIINIIFLEKNPQPHKEIHKKDLIKNYIILFAGPFVGIAYMLLIWL